MLNQVDMFKELDESDYGEFIDKYHHLFFKYKVSKYRDPKIYVKNAIILRNYLEATGLSKEQIAKRSNGSITKFVLYNMTKAATNMSDCYITRIAREIGLRLFTSEGNTDDNIPVITHKKWFC